MNNQKFCFIICLSNELLFEESMHYIDHLNIPEGYSTELLTISDASSIAEAYNDAMAATDAKYKIYLHQYVMLLNRDILSDLLQIFSSDPQIGLIGMIGYERISRDGVMWNQRPIGNVFHKSQPSYPVLSDYHYSLSSDGLLFAAEIDGFFMATSNDLPWNTELLKGWDFYDAFQSITFLEHGYKIAVPVQRHPWCLHDAGKLPDLSNYDRYRHLFMETYSQYLGRHWSEIYTRRSRNEQ